MMKEDRGRKVLEEKKWNVSKLNVETLVSEIEREEDYELERSSSAESVVKTTMKLITPGCVVSMPRRKKSFGRRKAVYR